MNKLMSLIARLPIVKLLLHHQEERCIADCEKREMLERQRDFARRVDVLEWWTFPHRTPQERKRQDAH